jgi:hypothetical protein
MFFEEFLPFVYKKNDTSYGKVIVLMPHVIPQKAILDYPDMEYTAFLYDYDRRHSPSTRTPFPMCNFGIDLLSPH